MKKVILKFFIFSFVILAIGCTKRPSPEQISLLEASEASATEAERELAALEKENDQLEIDLERIKLILAANKEERKFMREQKQ